MTKPPWAHLTDQLTDDDLLRLHAYLDARLFQGEERAAILAGNLCDGFTLWGPFDSVDAAFGFADGIKDETWMMTLNRPDSFEDGS